MPFPIRNNWTSWTWTADGDLDLLTHSWNDIRVLFNDGAGAFGTRIILDEERRVSSFAHGDMDGDGDLDIIYTGYDEGVVLLLQGPSGQFTRQEIGVDLSTAYAIPA
jgi:hypothetical protein